MNRATLSILACTLLAALKTRSLIRALATGTLHPSPWGMQMRSPEDLAPRDTVEPQQELNALRYELDVRLAPPYRKRRLIIRHFEDGTVVGYIHGPTMVIPSLREDGA
jgi:hypothetical protein